MARGGNFRGTIKRMFGDRDEMVKTKKINSLSEGINHDLNFGQKILGEFIKIDQDKSDVHDDLKRDIVWAVYNTRVDLREETPRGREFNRDLLMQVVSNQSWKRSVLPFAGRRLSAAVAAEQIYKELMSNKEIEEMMNQQAKADELDKKAEKLEEQANQAQFGKGNGEGSGNGKPKNSQQRKEANANKFRQQAQLKRQQANEIRQQAQERFDQTADGQTMRAQIQKGLKDGRKKGEDVADFIGHFGVDEGQNMNISPDEINAILMMLDTYGLSALSNLIGRTYGIASNVISGRAALQILVDEGGVTRRLSDMFATERARLTDAVPDFVRNDALTRMYRDNGLSGMIRTSQSEREGIKVFLKDTSSSMAESFSGAPSKNHLASGLILGLCKAATSAGQPWHAISFSSVNELTEVINNKSPLSDIFDWIAFMFNGGTDFCSPLNAAFDLIEKMPEEEREQADIVMLTDGDGSFDHSTLIRFARLKRRYGTRLYVLGIGDDGAGGALMKAADFVLSFTNIDETSERLSELLWGNPEKNKNQKLPNIM